MKSLTSVVLKDTKRNDRKNTKKESALAVLAFLIVFGFLAIIMISASIYITRKLSEFEQTYAFVNMLLLVNFILLFSKSIFESLNVLYFSKDLKMLIRMPIKSKDILHAKLISMITSEYEMEIIMLAIPIIVYGIFTNAGILFYLYMSIILLILPIIPILITSLIIAIIMRFTNKIKNKSKSIYLTIIIAVFLVGVVTGILSSGESLSATNFESIVLQENGLAESIADAFPLIKPIMNTLLNYDNINGLKNMCVYIIENLICYIVVLNIISKIYLKGAIGTTINGDKKLSMQHNIITKKDTKKKNKYVTYILKEWKVLARTPIFLIECIIMPVIYPTLVFIIMVVFVNFARSLGLDAMEEFYEKLTHSSGQVIFLSIGQVFYMMNFSSIISISKESKNSIITKYIPISLKKQFNLKIIIGFIINSITTIVVTICYYICTQNMANTIMIFINLNLANLIGEKFKVLIDLKNPRINWENEYTMMKQNTNVFYELFYTLIIIAILLIISTFISNIQLFLIFVLALNIIVNVILNEFIFYKQKDIFKKIY